MSYIITGGGSGIGQALSWTLAAQHQHVIIIGRREKALAETCSRFPSKIRSIAADLSQESGREKVIKELETITDLKINALVHCAGILEPLIALADVSLASWRHIQATNVEAPLFFTQKLLPWLTGGKVLMLSTQVDHVAQPFMGPYCVSKAGLFMLSQCLQLECQTRDIHVATMEPGIVDTAMFRALASSETISEKQRDFYQHVISKNIWIKPEVAASFIEWLLCGLDNTTFASQKWDIYDTAHHVNWVKGFSAPQAPGFA